MKAQKLFILCLLMMTSISVFGAVYEYKSTETYDALDLQGTLIRDGKDKKPDVSASTNGNGGFSISGNNHSAYGNNNSGSSTSSFNSPVAGETYEEIEITVYSDTGEIVYQLTSFLPNGSGTIDFQLPSTLDSGQYKLEIIFDDWLFEGNFTID